MRVSTEGKAALSLFEPAAIYPGASLMRVTLITGRTHQVRVHATHAGHPIAGDGKYGDHDFNKYMAGFGLGRLFLHAHSLTFTLPLEKPRRIQVVAPLGPELNAVLQKLEAAK